MGIEHLLAVVPVTDIARAGEWYERLLGRPADNRPMPSLVEWQAVPGGWIQVSVQEDRAGSGLLNLAVSDMEVDRAALRERGLEPGEVQTVTKGVQLSELVDPDGNRITLIGSFRVEY